MTRLSYIAQKEDIQAQDSALEVISRYVNGGLRDAIGLLEQLTIDKKLSLEHVQEILGISGINLLINLFNALLDNDVKLSLSIINELHMQGSDLKQFLHEFINLLREKMLEHIADEEIDKANRLIHMIEVFEETKMMPESDIPQLPLELAVIKITGNYVEYSATTGPMLESAERKHKPIEQKEEKTAENVAATKIVPKKSDKPAGSPESSDSNVPLTISYLKEKWPRITERVRRPALRMSLRSGLPIIVDGVNVTIEFDTKFHRDKMMEHENRIELESIIKDIFKKSVKISATVKELEIKSVVADDQNASPFPESTDDLTGQALEIFGGEIVED